MILNKKIQKRKIDNPFRVVNGVPRQFSICSFSKGYELVPEDLDYDLRIDFDPNEEFLQVLNDTCGGDYYQDKVLDLVFTKSDYFDKLESSAKTLFDKVTYAT